jgi:iron complex outermembrane recepter protein
MKSLAAHRAAFLGCVAALALAAPGTAFAQEEEAQPAGTADEAQQSIEEEGNTILVTATKREQTLQETPVAVTVTTAEVIERAFIRDIRDLASVVPSLRISQLQSSANTNFFIRGFGNGANNAGIEPSVGVFIDGVYRSRSAAQIGDFPDVQRIEVLRGPQSTLFGKNASAGVISVITREPQFDFGGNIEASYGNYDAIVVKGVVTGPITESIAVSLAGGINKRDGYVNNPITGNDINDRNRWFVRGQALFEPSTDFKVRLIGDYSKIDELCCAVLNLQPSAATAAITAPPPFGLGGRVNTFAERFDGIAYSNFDSTNEIENWGGSAQIDYGFGPLNFTSITAYRGVDSLTNQDSDFTSADLLGRQAQDLSIRTFTQELRLATDLEGPFNFLLGGFYFNEKIDQTNQVNWGTQARAYANLLIAGLTGCTNVPPAAGCTNVPALETQLSALSGQNLAGTFFGQGQGLTEAYQLDDESFSIFGQVDFEITPGLTLTGGINYTKDTKNFSTNTFSNDVFSGLDLVALGRTAILAQGLGARGVNFRDPAAVQAFATNMATAPIYTAIVNAANAGSTNPAVNPLLGLRPLQFFPPFQNLPNAVESGRISDDDLSFTARLAWDATDNINLYLAYATGYKPASVNLSRDSRPTAADVAALNAAGLGVTNLSAGSRFAPAEDSTVYEAGVKADWGLVTANVAVFKQIISNFQSNIFTGTGFFLASAGEQSTFGIEFEGMARPTPELTLTAALTYLDPKYDSFPNSAFGDASGQTPAGVPPLSMTLGATWDQPINNGDRIILRGDFHYEAAFKPVEGLPGFLERNPLTGVPNPASIAAAIGAANRFKREVNELNGSLTYAMANGLELSVWGRNLTDHRYIIQIFDSPAQQGSISGYPNQPRTYGVAARFKW